MRDDSASDSVLRIEDAVVGLLNFKLSATIALRASFVCKKGMRNGLSGKLKSLIDGGSTNSFVNWDGTTGLEGLSIASFCRVSLV